MGAILVVGSVGYDSISTPKGNRERILGGSANYFSMAASFFAKQEKGASAAAKIRVVGVVGDDYQDEHRRWLETRGVDLKGLQQVHGQTFTWSGKYEKDMNEAITMATHLNVFENFQPKIPAEYRDSKTVFLANIDPVLQLQVLEQVKEPGLIAADTMNYWISSKRADFVKVLERVDLLTINETEIRQLTGNWNTIQAAKEVAKMGPKAIIVKRGEYGFVLYCQEQFFILPAFPIENVIDPTGAGDTFAGGLLGHLAQLDRAWTPDDLKQACVYGCLLASFTVQDFGVEGIKRVEPQDLKARWEAYDKIISCPRH